MPANAGGAAFGQAFASEVSLEKGSSSGSDPVRIRQNFPETWLWESIDSGYENL